LEEWRYHATVSGCPQGSILSPVLANAYLNELDSFVETVLMPTYNKGQRRKPNMAYIRVQHEALRRKKAGQRKERTADTVYSLITQFEQEVRGFAEYYQLAVNRYQLNRLKWGMERSLVSTLAHKLRITVAKVYDRYETTIQTPEGLRKVLQVTVERKEGRKEATGSSMGWHHARTENHSNPQRPPCPSLGRSIRTRKTALGRYL
jgi:hypothetical protein